MAPNESSVAAKDHSPRHKPWVAEVEMNSTEGAKEYVLHKFRRDVTHVRISLKGRGFKPRQKRSK
jgi:hypothetical protein